PCPRRTGIVRKKPQAHTSLRMSKFRWRAITQNRKTQSAVAARLTPMIQPGSPGENQRAKKKKLNQLMAVQKSPHSAPIFSLRHESENQGAVWQSRCPSEQVRAPRRDSCFRAVALDRNDCAIAQAFQQIKGKQRAGGVVINFDAAFARLRERSSQVLRTAAVG